MRASIRELWSRKVRQLRNKRFLDAAMAAGALVSTADGVVCLSEQLALDELIARMDKLEVFDKHAGVDLHRNFVEGIEADPDAGRRAAMKAVSAFRGDAEHGQLILYVGATIARADLELTQNERRALEEICEGLGLEAAASLELVFGEGDPPAA